MKSDLTSRKHKHAHPSHQQRQPKYEPSPSSNPKWLIALIILLIIIVLGGMIYGGYRLSQVKLHLNTTDNQATTTQSEQNTATVHLDVLSYDFSQDFMHSDHIDGYQDFHIGETRKDVEATHGPPEKLLKLMVVTRHHMATLLSVIMHNTKSNIFMSHHIKSQQHNLSMFIKRLT